MSSLETSKGMLPAIESMVSPFPKLAGVTLLHSYVTCPPSHWAGLFIVMMPLLSQCHYLTVHHQSIRLGKVKWTLEDQPTSCCWWDSTLDLSGSQTPSLSTRILSKFSGTQEIMVEKHALFPIWKKYQVPKTQRLSLMQPQKIFTHIHLKISTILN